MSVQLAIYIPGVVKEIAIIRISITYQRCNHFGATYESHPTLFGCGYVLAGLACPWRSADRCRYPSGLRRSVRTPNEASSPGGWQVGQNRPRCSLLRAEGSFLTSPLRTGTRPVCPLKSQTVRGSRVGLRLDTWQKKFSYGTTNC